MLWKVNKYNNEHYNSFRCWSFKLYIFNVTYNNFWKYLFSSNFHWFCEFYQFNIFGYEDLLSYGNKASTAPSVDIFINSKYEPLLRGIKKKQCIDKTCWKYHFFIAFTASRIQRTLMVTQSSMFSIFGRSILSEARVRDWIVAISFRRFRLYGFSPVCVFKCDLKWPAWKDA